MEKISHVTSGKKLSNQNLWTFSLGGIGRDMSYSLWNGSLLLCIMYTKGIDAKQLSTILIMMALCRIWDAVNDPIMGGIIERTRTKMGKFKPWIISGAISNALITFTIFAVPLRGEAFVIFFPFAYLLWDISFTMNDIGYWSMLPSLTSNDTDRNKLTTLANLCAGIGGGIAGIIIPTFTTGALAIKGNAIAGFTIIAGIIGVCFIGFQLLTTLCVKEKELPPLRPEDKIGFKAMFKVILKNDQLLWIACVMIFYNLGSSLYFASTANYILFRFGYEGANVALFGTLGGLLGGISILYPWFSKRFSRKQISMCSIIVTSVGYVLMFILGAATSSTNNSGLVFFGLILTSSIIMVGQTMFYMVLTISIANTIEYNEWKSGKRDEGIIFSVRPFMAKIGSSLVVLTQAIIYSILGVANYTKAISDIENEANIMLGNGAAESVVAKFKEDSVRLILQQVPDDIKVWMLFGLTIIPMVFVITGYLIWRKKFMIDEDLYAKMVNENESRHLDNLDGLTENAATSTIA
ncbi:MAG: glycoside-pentoside-hexuronide (GPH):cation symporter [Clostridia bacterium]